MNMGIIAIFVQECGRIITEVIKTRPPKKRVSAEPVIEKEAPIVTTSAPIGSSSTEGTACLPCVNGHFSVCTGLISDEALRMARRHGITGEEIRRINKCLDQLNAMERDDLAIEKIKDLPEWEKDLAIYAQNESAAIRHILENLESVDDLEKAAIKIQKAREKIGTEYFEKKFAHLKKEKV